MASLEIFLWTDGDIATYSQADVRDADGQLKSKERLVQEFGDALAINSPIAMHGPDYSVLVPAPAIRTVVVRG